MASGEKIPQKIINALTDESITKFAFNANFERVALSKYIGVKIKPKGWKCTMVWSVMLGLPFSLEGVGKILNLEEQKIAEGKSLIKYFCLPCKPTKVNGGRTRNLPQHDIEKWKQFVEYNKRDVEVELQINKRLSRFQVSEQEWANYWLDQEINDRGILLDLNFVNQAISIDNNSRQSLMNKLKEVTELDNPNSVQQMKEWLNVNGLQVESLGKKDVAEMITDAPKKLVEVLELRQKLAKNSVKKYNAMEIVACKDKRARGLIQFYGASRTGRYSGRLIQVQNLPQNHLSDLEQARDLVKQGNFDALEILYDSIPKVLSELIRTAFITKENHRFIVCDFSAIEARVIAWLGGESWRNEVFESGGDIYCASASKMFNIPVEKNGINGHLRQKGKIAELALGYGGSVGALKSMGAIEMGLVEEELKPLVDAWRKANPNIVKLWWDVDNAVKTAIKTRSEVNIYGLTFKYESGILFIQLPSGRKLSYVKPKICTNQFGGEGVSYEGIGTAKKWERIESYGPKFVENIVQAISRDILAEAMIRLYNKGFDIVMHVHDEVVIEIENNKSSVDEVSEIMCVRPTWASDLLLNAEGFECDFYKKE